MIANEKKTYRKTKKFVDEYFWNGKAAEAAYKAEYKGEYYSIGYRNLENETIVNELETKVKENLDSDLMFINNFLTKYKKYLLSETNIKNKVKIRTKLLGIISDLEKQTNWLEEIQKG